MCKVATIHSLYAAFPILGIGMEHHFRIRVTGKYMSGGRQFPAKLLGIVKLPIVYQNIGFSGPHKLHGLPPALRINYCQTGMEQRHQFLPVDSPGIRSSAVHGFQHARKHRIFDCQSDQAGNSAHMDHILSILLLYV